jgi:hypothetical protein
MPSKTSARISHKCGEKTTERAATSTARLAAYWESRLKRMNLSMERGHDPHWLSYGHDVTALDFDGRDTFAFVPPAGERLDMEEWPISLR